MALSPSVVPKFLYHPCHAVLLMIYLKIANFLFRSAAMAKVTAESLYNDLKSNGTLKEEVLTILKRVWSEQVHIDRQ